MFPNSGTRVELRTFSRIYDNEGAILVDNTSPIEIPAISDVSAYWMTDMLVDAVVAGTGGSANLGRMPTAGKTGTSSDSKDRWFVGYTPYYLAAVWTGFDTPAEMKSSGNPAAQIWKMLMAPIHEGLLIRQFNRPADVTLDPILNRFEMDMASYTVLGVDTSGGVIYENVIPSAIGTEVTAHAPGLWGWRVVGQSFGAVHVSADSSRNVIRFVYEWVGAPDPEPEPDPDPTPPPIIDPTPPPVVETPPPVVETPPPVVETPPPVVETPPPETGDDPVVGP